MMGTYLEKNGLNSAPSHDGALTGKSVKCEVTLVKHGDGRPKKEH
jgi:hypothetical protein